MNNLLVRDVKYLDEQYRIGEGIISDDAFKQLEKLLIFVDPEPDYFNHCLLYTSPSPRDKRQSRMPSSA